MPEQGQEYHSQEEQLEAIKANLVRIITNSGESESFTGIPPEVRPSLAPQDEAKGEQLQKLLQEFTNYLIEVAKTPQEEIKVYSRYVDVNEDRGTTYSRNRIQLASQRPDEHGWFPQLWVSEEALIEDEAEENPDRIDRSLMSTMRNAAERFRRLSETDVALAAEQRPRLERQIADALYKPFEEAHITFQMSNPKEKQVRALIGIKLQRCHAGLQAWPFFVLGARREVTDLASPLVRSTQSEGLNSDWVDKEVFDQSEIGKFFKDLIEKVLSANQNRV